MSSGGSNILRQRQLIRPSRQRTCTHRHLSSTTLITDRRPFCANFGVGTAASEPSPRKNGPSSHLVSWAASRMVKGRTRTVTEIEDAPPSVLIVVYVQCFSGHWYFVIVVVVDCVPEKKECDTAWDWRCTTFRPGSVRDLLTSACQRGEVLVDSGRQSVVYLRSTIVQSCVSPNFFIDIAKIFYFLASGCKGQHGPKPYLLRTVTFPQLFAHPIHLFSTILVISRTKNILHNGFS